MNDLSIKRLRKTPSENSLALYIVSIKAKRFLREQAEKHNVSMSEIAQALVMRGVEANSTDKWLVDHFKKKEFAKRKQDFIVYRNKKYNRSEVEMLADVLHRFKLESIECNASDFCKMFVNDRYLESKLTALFRRMRNEGMFLLNRYNADGEITNLHDKWGEITVLTLHKDVLGLVNKAIDEGFLHEL